MAPIPLDPLRRRFTAYVRSFAAADGTLAPMMQLKLDHSLRVSRDCRDVAVEEGWPKASLDLAEAAGLLHDVGRFEQCRRYGTFADRHSVDHGDLGLRVLDCQGFLGDTAAELAAALRAAVRCHNKHAIPDDLPAGHRPLVQLVRDADKLDIMTVVEEAVRTGAYARNPGILLNVVADAPPTPELVAEVRAGATGSYAHVHSLADIRLVGLSWTRDIASLPVLERLRQRGLTAGLGTALAGYPDVKPLVDELLCGMECRLSGRPAARAE